MKGGIKQLPIVRIDSRSRKVLNSKLLRPVLGTDSEDSSCTSNLPSKLSNLRIFDERVLLSSEQPRFRTEDDSKEKIDIEVKLTFPWPGSVDNSLLRDKTESGVLNLNQEVVVHLSPQKRKEEEKEVIGNIFRSQQKKIHRNREGFIIFSLEDTRDDLAYVYQSYNQTLASYAKNPIEISSQSTNKLPLSSQSQQQHIKTCTCTSCRKKKIHMKKLLLSTNSPCYYKITSSNKPIIKYILESNGMSEYTDSPSSSLSKSSKSAYYLIWHSHYISSTEFKYICKYQKVNLFPKSYECTRKDTLSRNINYMKSTYGQLSYDFFPECYVYPDEKKAIEQASRTYSGPWIIKPASSSQGKGIFITENLRDLPGYDEDRASSCPHIMPPSYLLNALDQNQNQSQPINPKWIIERYIFNPLLLDGFKFDLRLYVAVTSFCPLKIYLHKQGLVRLATERYQTNRDSYSEVFAHLTNYSVNKNNLRKKTNTTCAASPVSKADIAEDDRVHTLPNEPDASHGMSCGTRAREETVFRPVEGSEEEVDGGDEEEAEDLRTKMSLSELDEKLVDMGLDTERLWVRIKDLIAKTMIAIETKVVHAVDLHRLHHDNCFQLFGFDVLVDSECNPWLLEVNLSPSLNTDSLLDFQVKTQVLVDLFNVVGIRPPRGPRVSRDVVAAADFQLGLDVGRSPSGSAPDAVRTGSDDSCNTPMGGDGVSDADGDRAVSSTGRGRGSRESDESLADCGDTHEKRKDSDRRHPVDQCRSHHSKKHHFPSESSSSSAESQSPNISFIEIYHLLKKKHFEQISDVDRRILISFCLENDRSGGFECVFPSASYFENYRKLFEEERPINLLLGKFMFLRAHYLELQHVSRDSGSHAGRRESRSSRDTQRSADQEEIREGGGDRVNRILKKKSSINKGEDSPIKIKQSRLLDSPYIQSDLSRAQRQRLAATQSPRTKVEAQVDRDIAAKLARAMGRAIR